MAKEATTEKPKEKEEAKTLSELTPEQLEEQGKQFFEHFYPGGSTKQKESKAEDTPPPEPAKKPDELAKPPPQPAVEDPEPEPEPKPEPEPEPAPAAKVAPVTVPPTLSEFDSKAASDRRRQAEAPKKEEQESKLTRADKIHLQVFKRMGKLNPKYADLEQRHLQYLAKEATYITHWLDEHPGEDYQADSEDHAEFYRRHEPRFDEFDYQEARDQIITENATRDSESSSRKAIKELESRIIAKEVEPAVQESSYLAALNFIVQADDGFKEYAETGSNGSIKLKSDTIEKWQEENPVISDLLREEAEPISVMVGELERLIRVPGYKLDENKSVHLKLSDRQFMPDKELLNFIVQHQADQLRRPAIETMRNGKRLVATDAFEEQWRKFANDPDLTKAQKEQLLSELDASYYCLEIEDFKAALVAKHALKAKSKVEKLRSALKKMTKSGQEEHAEPATEKAQKPETTPEQKPAPAVDKAGRSKPPSSASASERVDTSKKAPTGSGATVDDAMNIFFPGHTLVEKR